MLQVCNNISLYETLSLSPLSLSSPFSLFFPPPSLYQMIYNYIFSPDKLIFQKIVDSNFHLLADAALPARKLQLHKGTPLPLAAISPSLSLYKF